MREKFGSSSEKIPASKQESPGASAKLGDAIKLELNKKTSFEEIIEKKKPKRMKLPGSLPRIEALIAPPVTCEDCGSEKFRKIAEDVSETLEYIPGSFKVIKNIRPRCVCLSCDKIVQALPPSSAIDKGKAGAGLLAHVLVQKYCNHLPLYRQSQMYEREGVIIPRSTMSGWVGACSSLLAPLITELRDYVCSGSEINGDDTPIRVLAPGTGKTKTGRLWTYVRDGRPHGDKNPVAACYFYSPDRKGERPYGHLKDFKGVLHADAYSGYDKIYDNKAITEAACWAHTRRKFYEITVMSEHANIARNVLEEIGKVYEVEENIRGLSSQERLKARTKHSKPLVDKLFKSLKKEYKNLPKKSSTAKAIAYALNNEEALKRFLENGRIEIDNNAAERAMRVIALGRKNYLFAGSDAGGERAAAIYSLIETAKLNGINPWLYLREVLGRIQDHNSQKLAELLPWNIKLEGEQDQLRYTEKKEASHNPNLEDRTMEDEDNFTKA